MPVLSFSRSVRNSLDVVFEAGHLALTTGTITQVNTVEIDGRSLTEYVIVASGLFEEVSIIGAFPRNLTDEQVENTLNTIANIGNQILRFAVQQPASDRPLLVLDEISISTTSLVLAVTFPNQDRADALARLILGQPDLRVDGTSLADHMNDSAFGRFSSVSFAGDNLINLKAGNDLVDAGGGNDTIFGGSGRDRIDGGGDRDKLFGGGGADVLDGGRGHDVLTGGNGADVFVLRSRSGADTVTDFQIGVDVIDLRGNDSFGVSTNDRGAVISFGAAKMTLLGLTEFQILSSDETIFV